MSSFTPSLAGAGVRWAITGASILAAIVVAGPTSAQDAGPDTQTDVCTVAPPLQLDATLTLDFDLDGERALETGVGFDVTGELTSRGQTGTGDCEIGVTGAGTHRVCATLVGQQQCQDLPLGGSGSCAAPLLCEAASAPNYTCDGDNRCCAGVSESTVDLELEWLWEQRIGPWACQLAATGTLSGGFTAHAEWGVGCDCPEGAASVESTLELAAEGDATCTLSLFGGQVPVQVQGNACASVEQRGQSGCDADLSESSAAAVSLSLPSAQVQWLELGGLSQTWRTEGECP